MTAAVRPPSRRREAEALRDEAERLCGALVARDPLAVPVYVVDASAMPPELRGATAGYTGALVDVLARDAIGPRWQGRGASIVIDFGWLWRHAADCAKGSPRAERPGRRRAFARQLSVGIALHELAHVVDRRFFRDVPDDADHLAAAVLNYSRALADDAPPEDTDAPPFHGHESGWVRFALHLAHRAGVLGFEVPWPDVIDYTAYGLSPPWRYMRALGGEPRRMLGCPPSQINRTSPPAAFMTVWQSDSRTWRSKREELLK